MATISIAGFGIDLGFLFWAIYWFVWFIIVLQSVIYGTGNFPQIIWSTYNTLFFNNFTALNPSNSICMSAIYDLFNFQLPTCNPEGNILVQTYCILFSLYFSAGLYVISLTIGLIKLMFCSIDIIRLMLGSIYTIITISWIVSFIANVKTILRRK